jgi:hypothetical protein
VKGVVGAQRHSLESFLQGEKQHSNDSSNSIASGEERCGRPAAVTLTSFLQVTNIAAATAATSLHSSKTVVGGQRQSLATFLQDEEHRGSDNSNTVTQQQRLPASWMGDSRWPASAGEKMYDVSSSILRRGMKDTDKCKWVV